MPDAAITEALVRASAHKRVEDLQALVAAVLASPGLVAHHQRWQQLSQDLAAWDGQQVLAIGSSPLFRRWLHASGRALIAGAPPQALEPLLASVQNYTRGIGASGDISPRMLLSRQGCIETWDCANSVHLPEGMPDRAWVAVRTNKQLQLNRPDIPQSPVRLALSQPQARLPASDIVVRNDLPGLRIALDETRTPERTGSVRDEVVDDRQDAYPPDRCGPIVEAAGLVLAVWPEEYQDWRWMMRVVVPRLPPSGWRMNGFTLSSMQGASWVYPTDLLATLESLVHEHSHVKLRYIEESASLLQPEQTDARFAVGWRSDPRPLVGIFEGVYVHLHCVLALARCLSHGCLAPSLRDNAAKRMAELHAQAREGLALLRGHARFTQAGQGFLRWAEAVSP
jgi:HEXXH motif-containing protein